MAADNAPGEGDVTEQDLGTYQNYLTQNIWTALVDVFGWFKSAAAFLLSAMMIVITATINLVPKIFALLSQLINSITNVNFPTDPGQLPGADWIILVNTFFPLEELCSAITVFCTLYFTFLVIRITVSIIEFGLKYTIGIIKILLVP